MTSSKNNKINIYDGGDSPTPTPVEAAPANESKNVIGMQL